MSENTNKKEASKKKEGDERPAKPAGLSVPMLDSYNYKLLHGNGKERLHGMTSITVEFFQTGGYQVLYKVDEHSTGQEQILGPAEINFAIRERARKGQAEQEESASVGMFRKLGSRCCFQVADQTVAGARAIGAGTLPKPARVIMGLSQKQLAEKGLNDPDATLKYWDEMRAEVKEEMDAAQVTLDPRAGSWTTNITEAIASRAKAKDDALSKKAAKAALWEEKKKLMGATETTSGPTSQKSPAAAPTEEWGNDEEDDAEGEEPGEKRNGQPPSNKKKDASGGSGKTGSSSKRGGKDG